jgi:hypothetical protein
MVRLQEGELQFEFRGAIAGMQFDADTGDGAHGLSHCLSAVDFVVEYPDYFLFVEVKDPDARRARDAARTAFATELLTDEFAQKMGRKYRDSALYRWAERRTNKPFRFVVVVQLKQLTAPHFLTLTDALRRAVPASGPRNGRWKRPIVESVAVMDVSTWNRVGEYGSITRVA